MFFTHLWGKAREGTTKSEKRGIKRERVAPAPAEFADYENVKMIFTVTNTMRNDEKPERAKMKLSLLHTMVIVRRGV